MAGSDSRDLTRAEQSYVAQVRYQLRHLPQQRQHQILQDVRRVLLRGTPYDAYARLEKEMGSPAQYADRLLGRQPVDDAPALIPAQKSGWLSRKKSRS